MSDSIAFVVADVSRMMRKRFDVAARKIGVTGPQWRVLFIIHRRPGINQGQLADTLEVEPITTCRMVDRLETAGLIERRRDPSDRRAWQLFLTDAAAPLLERVRTVAEEMTDIVTVGLTDAEKQQLVAILGRLRENLLNDMLFDAKDLKIG